MKRNLFAIFLAMALVVALVFVVAPSAKADSYAFSEEVQELEITNDAVLDLAGFSGKVTLTNGAKLTVYDSGNSSKTGADAAKLTVEGDGSVEKISLQKGYRYLKVENADGTYSFHPFNMAFTHVGLNTKTNSVCVRVAFVANDVVKAKLTDYGIYSVEFDAYASSQEKYPFGEQNGVYAYYDFENSFGADDMDATKPIKLYMTVDGETIETEYTANIIPREVLKDVNKAGTSIANEPQLDRITDMIDGNDRIANILTNFRAETGTATLSFTSTANRVSLTASKQVWTQNGITLTNNKASSTNDVADYSNPVRIYKGSQVVIEATGMTKIVFNCSASDYAATGLSNTSDYTVTKNGNVTTVEFTTPVDSFTFSASSSQLRFNSITVSATFAPACEHLKDATEATCTKGAVCIDCEKEHGDLLDHVEKTAATCSQKAVCKNCGETYGEVAKHNYPENSHNCTFGCDVVSICVDEDDDGFCDVCGESMSGAPVIGLLATFSLGANGSASHADGSSATSYSETVNGYTLNLSNCSGVYKNARDAKGNSCIKLGAKSSAGKFTITVPENVTEVVSYVAKYKTNTTKITVNSTNYTISSASDNGAYDAITVDTTTTKTISFTTVSGGYRAMVNTIVFNGYAQ